MQPSRLDTVPRPRYAGPRRARGSLAALLASPLAFACAPPPPPPPDPAIDAERVAAILEAATRLEEPARIVFTWSLDERDLRLGGRGVARVEPPYRARLDLFLDNGEAVVAAALVGDELRLPPGAPEGIIPPPDLLWGVLGVFNPGASAALLGADSPQPGSIRLRYGYSDGTRLHYTASGSRIVEVELLRDGQVVRRVSMQESDDGVAYPREAVYRDLEAFRELRITRESVEHVEPYPQDIWTVG